MVLSIRLVRTKISSSDSSQQKSNKILSNWKFTPKKLLFSYLPSPNFLGSVPNLNSRTHFSWKSGMFFNISSIIVVSARQTLDKNFKGSIMQNRSIEYPNALGQRNSKKHNLRWERAGDGGSPDLKSFWTHLWSGSAKSQLAQAETVSLTVN